MHGDPDGGSEVEAQIAALERLLEGAADGGGHPHRERLAGATDEDGELVATEASNGRVHAEHLAKTGGHLLQDQVPGVMAERVVDVLEPVEIHQKDGGRFL